MSVITQERRNEIAQKLIKDKTINAAMLAEAYHVSKETIRKDLIWLEQQGVAKKSYGGAVVSTELIEQSFLEKAVKNQSEKQQIAQCAASLINDGDTVILDSGSTVYTLAQQIGLLHKEITVFTNSIKAVQCLTDAQIRVYMLGGEVRSTSNAATGGWALYALAQIKADIAFLGTSGFGERSGPCIESFEESEVKQAMIKAADKAVVLADHSKVTASAMVQYTSWSEIDRMITDRAADREMPAQIGRATQIVYA